MNFTLNAARAAFLAGTGTLTAAEVITWARELDASAVQLAMADNNPPPPETPLMVSVIPEPDTRGLLGATIIPSVVRSRPPSRR